MQNKKIRFDNDAGHSLAGLMALPEAEPRAYALFAHCFTCSKNLKTATNIARALTDSGIAVLRFDFTGLGQSEGDFADTNFSSNVSDFPKKIVFVRLTLLRVFGRFQLATTPKTRKFGSRMQMRKRWRFKWLTSDKV